MGKKKKINKKITYYNNGKRIHEIIYLNEDGLIHRDKGIAKTKFSYDGKKERDEYYKNGVWHRLDGPALIRYFDNGNVRSNSYIVNGLRHRLDGPAIIWYCEDGSIRQEFYCINDIEYEDVFKYEVMAASLK